MNFSRPDCAPAAKRPADPLDLTGVGLSQAIDWPGANDAGTPTAPSGKGLEYRKQVKGSGHLRYDEMKLWSRRLVFCLAFFCLASEGARVLQTNPVFAQETAAAVDPLRNENRIIRAEPSPAAARIGSAVAWVADWDEAVKRSRESGKPIFWYVPTIPGTFMDRKVEVDRYMLAGPFSNPKIIARLNRDFIPTRGGPNESLAKQFDLLPYNFVEPGFLVVDSKLKVTQRVDRLTTLHADWLTRLIGVPEEPPQVERATGTLPAAWEAFRDGVTNEQLPEPEADSAFAAEIWLLKGMFAFRRGEQELARELWRRASQAQPESPLAWKAAAEAEGFGPFVRGFETWSRLPDGAWLAGVKSLGSAAPPGVYDEAALWQRGVRFLLEMQRADGAIVDSDYDFGGYDSLPNVHVAITCLAGIALLEARERLAPELRPEIEEAIALAAGYVCNEANLNPNDADEILWAYAYRTQFLAQLVRLAPPDRAAGWQVQLQATTAKLESIQLKSGGWAHEYANPFVTATALAALHAAQQAGAKIDSEKLTAGLQALQGDRFSNGAYPYNSRRSPSRPRSEANPPGTAASAGRMAVGELALWYWQKIDQSQLQQAAEISLAGQEYLDRAYKYDNHTSTMAYGGFFFWYDMQSRAELISQIANEDVRKELAKRQREIMLRLPEVDGCFVDSHELGRCYGTAMALQSFALLDQAESDQPGK